MASAPLHVLAAYRQHATGRKAIIFVPTLALAHQMAAVFREAGIRAEALDGKTPWNERRAILARLHSGETRVVANVAVLGEGVDVPSVDAVILATPTRSQVKYTQCLGRGLRTFSGKEDCLVIDVVGASERLDLQTLPRLFNSAQTNVEPKASASGRAIAAWALAGRCWSAAIPPSPEPEARLPRIALRLLVIAEARITDSTAVPIEAPAWRMMFIAVLVRAIAAGGTACTAAVMFGIIASPVPRPWTKFAQHSKT